MSLERKFYERDTAEVARDLIGKVLSRTSRDGVLRGRIVETEAYYGADDPASRASGKRTKVNEMMWGRGGVTLVYMVHANWLFNAITEEEGCPGGVLIRALEPLEGLEEMKRRRGTSEELELTSGPGKLTQALGISKDHHGLDLTESGDVFISDPAHGDDPVIETSHRIGVTEDLERELRFFDSGSDHVS